MNMQHVFICAHASACECGRDYDRKAYLKAYFLVYAFTITATSFVGISNDANHCTGLRLATRTILELLVFRVLAYDSSISRVAEHMHHITVSRNAKANLTNDRAYSLLGTIKLHL